MTADQAPDVRADEATPAPTFNFGLTEELSQETRDELYARRGRHWRKERRTIHVNDDLALVISELAEALMEGDPSAWLFADPDGVLMELFRDDAGEMRRRRLTEAAAREALYRSAHVVKGTAAGCAGVACFCPAGSVTQDLLRTVMHAAGKKARPIYGVRPYPIIAPNGAIVAQPGYDPQTKNWLDVAEDLTVPENPTEEDAMAAAEVLRDLLTEFPLVDRDIDAANWMGYALTLLAKSFVGKTPVFIITGNGKNTGKTTLAHLPYLALTGQEPFAEGDFPLDGAEQAKWMTSALMVNRGLTLLDNLRAGSEVRGDALAKALTSDRWSARRLGSNDSHISLPVLTVFAATGNQVRAGEDTRRRACTIKLEYAGNAAKRTFNRSLYQHVLQSRSAIVSALLTIMAAWMEAGQPDPEGRLLNGFEKWHRTIGGALHFAGVKGFMERLEEELDASDSDDDVWLEHLGWIEKAFGKSSFTIKEIYDALLDDAEFDEGSRPMPPNLDLHRSGNVAQRLGHAYRRIQGQYFSTEEGTVVLQAVGKASSNVRQYRVERHGM